MAVNLKTTHDVISTAVPMVLSGRNGEITPVVGQVSSALNMAAGLRKARINCPSCDPQLFTTATAPATRMRFLHYAPIKIIGATVEMTPLFGCHQPYSGTGSSKGEDDIYCF